MFSTQEYMFERNISKYPINFRNITNHEIKYDGLHWLKLVSEYLILIPDVKFFLQILPGYHRVFEEYTTVISILNT